MLLNIGNKTLTLDDFQSTKFLENKFSKNELKVTKLVNDWITEAKNFTLVTSGSTGTPQPITLSRETLAYSAVTTMNFIDPHQQYARSLLCISPDYVGGLMAVVRALIFGWDLTVVDPCANPLKGKPGDSFDLISMVPLQVQTILDDSPETFDSVNTVLIGGAPLNPSYLKQARDSTCRFYQTYGMTETASHIALDDLTNEDRVFTTLGDLDIDQNDQSCLKIKGEITQNQWIQTRDIVTILDPKSFRWVGRKDFVINSGGYKVHPEKVEAALSGHFHNRNFLLGGVPDERLGQQVILIIEGAEEAEMLPDFSLLHPYERPKKIVFLDKLEYTESGKIDRNKTIKAIL